MDLGGQLMEQLALEEFSYNNIYHSSTEIKPFESLYGSIFHSLF